MSWAGHVCKRGFWLLCGFPGKLLLFFFKKTSTNSPSQTYLLLKTGLVVQFRRYKLPPTKRGNKVTWALQSKRTADFKRVPHEQSLIRQVWRSDRRTHWHYPTPLLPPADEGWRANFFWHFLDGFLQFFSPFCEQQSWALHKTSRWFLGWIDLEQA